jgi:mRNA-degrading endonuclease RelE of RelBE toxin-antitoxin system
MTTRVELLAGFKRALGRLGRKFPRAIDEVERLIDSLEADERPGDKIPGVGYDVYKVRLKNPSARKGKRGGLRAIYYVQLVDLVVLLTIYAKSEQADISVEQLRRIIADYAALQQGDERAE